MSSVDEKAISVGARLREYKTVRYLDKTTRPFGMCLQKIAKLSAVHCRGAKASIITNPFMLVSFRG